MCLRIFENTMWFLRLLPMPIVAGLSMLAWAFVVEIERTLDTRFPNNHGVVSAIYYSIYAVNYALILLGCVSIFRGRSAWSYLLKPKLPPAPITEFMGPDGTLFVKQTKSEWVAKRDLTPLPQQPSSSSRRDVDDLEAAKRAAVAHQRANPATILR